MVERCKHRYSFNSYVNGYSIDILSIVPRCDSVYHPTELTDSLELLQSCEKVQRYSYQLRIKYKNFINLCYSKPHRRSLPETLQGFVSVPVSIHLPVNLSISINSTGLANKDL